MARTKSTAKTGNGGRGLKRSAKTGQFVLGRAAFGKVSEVEGVVPSPGLKADLKRLSAVSPDKRRAALSQKYGKK